MVDIEFLTNQANKVEGLAYAGFETFRGSPYTSCARETGQNSRDAAVGSEPVRVSFDLREVPRADVPFADRLQHSIECCLADPRDDKTRLHLERARQTISAPVIKVLEIADVNTSGLTGPLDDPHSVFAALVKGDGVTNKADATSAGSYGIGKNAAYAVSDLQTVIYSSRWHDPQADELAFACQGRLRLISHTDGEKKLSAEGYWGRPGFEAVQDELEVPVWLRRAERGTSIYSVGFREQEHWVARMSLSLATNFFLAIDRREIEFSVGNGEVLINQSTLDSILADPQLEAAADETDQTDALLRARRLLTCVRSDAAQRHTISIRNLGDFTMHLLVAEGLPREVHVLRNGIYITNNFAKFGQPMKQFPRTREFIAVLEPARSDAGRAPSELLKQLENPAHDSFEPERIVDPQGLQAARAQIKALISKVREIIRATAKMEDIDRSQLDELSHLFAADGAKQDIGGQDEERDPEDVRFGEARRGRRAPPAGTSGTGSGRRRGGGGRRGPSVRTGQGRRSRTPAGTQAAVPLKWIRSVIPPKSDDRHRSIFFTPPISGHIELIVEASGLSSDAALRVATSDRGEVVGGRVRTFVEAGQRADLHITFAEAFSGPIELKATAVPNSVASA
jgi:hypothetical protein